MTPAESGMERIRTLIGRLIQDEQQRRVALIAVEGAYSLGIISVLEEVREMTSVKSSMASADETRPQ